MKKHKHYYNGIFVEDHFNRSQDHGAPDTSDQKPVKTWTGRGLEGNDFYVTIHNENPFDAINGLREINPDAALGNPDGNPLNENYDQGLWKAENHPSRREGIDFEFLDGWVFDKVTKKFDKHWTTQNIHGGHLTYHVNHHYDDDPKWFTITFIYTKAGVAEGGHQVPPKPPYGWHFTTPAIPYTGNIGKDMIGSGVSTIWINSGADPNADDPNLSWTTPNPENPPTFNTDYDWSEYLVYPLDEADPDPSSELGYRRYDPRTFNAPQSPNVDQGKPHNVQPWFENEKDWSVNLQFGKDGNIGVPNWPELADEVDGSYKRKINPDGSVTPDNPGTDIYHPGRGNTPPWRETAIHSIRGSYWDYFNFSADRQTEVQREMQQNSIDDVDIGHDAQVNHNKLARMPRSTVGNVVLQNTINGTNPVKPQLVHSRLTGDMVEWIVNNFTDIQAIVNSQQEDGIPVRMKMTISPNSYATITEQASNGNRFFTMQTVLGNSAATLFKSKAFQLTTGANQQFTDYTSAFAGNCNVNYPSGGATFDASSANQWLANNPAGDGKRWAVETLQYSSRESIGHQDSQTSQQGDPPPAQPMYDEYGINTMCLVGPVDGYSNIFACLVNTGGPGSGCVIDIVVYLKKVNA